MTNFIIFNFILLILFGGGYIVNNCRVNYQFFDFSHTTILKAIGAILVLWGHVALVNGVHGVQFIAGTGVTLFLICSGYGLEESLKKNGLANFWKKKIFNVIIPYYIICLAGYLINHFSIDEFSPEQILSILFFQSQWYINFLLVNYIIFYLVYRLINNSKKRIFVFAVVYIVWFFVDSLFFASATAPFLRARQMGAFISGIAISKTKTTSEKNISSSYFIILNMIIGIIFMGLTNSYLVNEMSIIVSNFLSLFTVVPLAYAVIGITLRNKKIFENYFLFFCGTISYEMFLIHSYSLSLTISNYYLIIVFTIFVFGLSYIFNNIYKKIKERYL